MNTPAVGDRLTLTFESAAFGGEAVGRAEGLVVFVPEVIPGDRAEIQLDSVKKRFARGHLVELLEPAPGRTPHRCEAAQHGAGCCAYSFVDPQTEIDLKKQVLVDQLQRIAKLDSIPEIDVDSLEPKGGWRSRFRFGVDANGRAGIRAKNSNELIVSYQCVQAPEGGLDGILGESAKRFTPGAEVVVAFDSNGDRHVLESAKAARGRTVSRVNKLVEGSSTLRQRVGDTAFDLQPLNFWQAHVAAPEAYSRTISAWIASSLGTASEEVQVAWDLYGGVGLFVPALLAACPNAKVVSVESAATAAKVGRVALKDKNVEFLTKDVGAAVPHLLKPQVVVLDPPRKGAGADVMRKIAHAKPELVIHIGCDPATCARDLATWKEAGYELEEIKLFNAFPGTYHFETFCLLTQADQNQGSESEA